MRASDDIVDAMTDVLILELAVHVHFDGLIGFDEIRQLLLKVAVLIVQSGHVLVKGIDLLPQVILVPQHLVRVLLDAVHFEGYRFFILLEFAEDDLELLALETTVLASDVLVFVRLE